MTLLTFGTKLVLIGGIIFVTALIVYMQPSLGFEEQVLLSWAMMVSFLVWMVGGVYIGAAGDQWLSRGIQHQSKQK
jgi:hypothetical protein